jgi:hypothetical protein
MRGRRRASYHGVGEGATSLPPVESHPPGSDD